MRSRIIFALLAIVALTAQISGPSVRVPYLNVGTGTRATTGSLKVQNDVDVGGNFTVTGTCTGCGAATTIGATEVAYGDSMGAITSDGAMTFNDSTGTLSVTHVVVTDCTGCGSGVTQTTGTFTATFDNACTTSPTLTISYTLTGNVVTLNIPALTNCTSDSSSYSSNAGDMPVSIRPTSSPKVVGVSAGTDNGSAMGSCVGVTSGGSLFFRPNGTAGCPGGSTWTSSGTKNGNLNINNVTYSLD